MLNIKADYDRLILSVLALLAAGASLWLLSAGTEAREQAALAPAPPKEEPFVQDPAVDTLKTDKADLSHRTAWRESKASPFVSRVYLLKDGKLVDILDAGTELFPGVPNAWILEHGLDYLDPRLPSRDPDGDGFTNIEEFQAQTNPLDPASAPPDWTKLRLVDVGNERFPLIFTGGDLERKQYTMKSVAAASDSLSAIGPDRKYTLNEPLNVVKYLPSSTSRCTTNSANFKISQVDSEKVTRKGIELTVLSAILESTKGDGVKVKLEKGKPQISPYSLVTLLDTRPSGATFQVKMGDIFEFGASGRYKLVDVSDKNATIADQASGETHTIPKAEPIPPPEAAEKEPQAQ